MQEMGENGVDAAHFLYVHGTDDVPEAAYQTFDGHIREGKFITRQPTPRGVVDGAIETKSQGAGLSMVKFTGIYDTLLLANVTPIAAEKARASYAFIQPRDTMDTLGKTVGQAIIGNICQQMSEDKIIWDRKQYFERPLLCDGDGPFAKFRRLVQSVFGRENSLAPSTRLTAPRSEPKASRVSVAMVAGRTLAAGCRLLSALKIGQCPSLQSRPYPRGAAPLRT